MKSRLAHNKHKKLYRYGLRGTKHYERPYSPLERSSGFLLLVGSILLGATLQHNYRVTESADVRVSASDTTRGVESNTSPEPIQVSPEPIPTEIIKDESYYINEAVDKYLPTHKSEALMIMHCLAHREAKHGAQGKETDVHGDGGLAGGPFQFHPATWTRMRTQMLNKGLIEDIGSRYNFRQSAHTTAWALANGRALEWGPILRASKGSDYATCPVPSWSN